MPKEVKTILAQPSAVLLGDAAGVVALFLLLFVGLHLPGPF